MTQSRNHLSYHHPYHMPAMSYAEGPHSMQFRPPGTHTEWILVALTGLGHKEPCQSLPHLFSNQPEPPTPSRNSNIPTPQFYWQLTDSLRPADLSLSKDCPQQWAQPCFISHFRYIAFQRILCMIREHSLPSESGGHSAVNSTLTLV